MGLGVIGFQADGLLKLANGLIGLALLHEGVAEVVVEDGVIGVESNGFPVLADGLVNLAFLEKGGAETVMRKVIVLCDFNRMTEKSFTILPIPELLPCQPETQNKVSRFPTAR